MRIKTATQVKMIMALLVTVALGSLYLGLTLTGVLAVIMMAIGVLICCLITAIIVLNSIFGTIFG